MALKHKLLSSWHKFLQTNFNTYLRSAPLIGKERRYQHIDIQKQFNQYEQERRRQRLDLIEYKQQLRKNILSKELKLLSQVDLQEDKRITQNSELNQQILDRLRTQITENQDERKQIILKQIADIETQLKTIEAEKKELKIIQQQIEELEPNLVLLQGTEKKVILNMIQYYEFQQRHIAGVYLNPETQDNLEKVHYRVQNNLPVQREMLYEVVPELFEQEIGELEEYKRKLIEKKRPKLLTDQQSIVQVVEKLSKSNTNVDVYEQMKDQEMEMMDFIYKKCQEFCDKYDNYIEIKLKTGIPTVEEIFDRLSEKKEEDLIQEEKEVWLDYQELVKLNKDYDQLIELNKVRVFKQQRELDIPEFIKQNETLTKAYIQKWEQIVKNSFDLSDSFLIPDNSSNYESKLDYAIAQFRKQDIQLLIEESQNEYKQVDNEPVRKLDRKVKDENLVKKMQVMTGLMHSLPTDQDMKKIISGKRLMTENPLLTQRSEEQRILVDELPKVLYLNNENPQKYNLLFWAKHFNIEPQKLRNIFNYISYPIISADSNKETNRILRFIQFNEEDSQKEQVYVNSRS